MKTKILFINAIDSSKEIQTSLPPLGIGYLISSLKERFGTDILNIKTVNRPNHLKVSIIIRQFKPDIVGISAVTQNFNEAKRYAIIAKLDNCKVIIGGIHISMMPSSLTSNMDIGVIGEGEKTICDLVELYLDEGSFDPKALQTIKGIVYYDNGKLVVTDKRKPIECLDSLTPPDRTLFPKSESTYMFTSRGCPYECAFCSSTRFWNGKVRYFSAKYIASEIKELVESGVKHIHLFDDLFPANIERVRNLYSILKDDGIISKVDFSCAFRANIVNDEAVSLLKKLGVKTIGVGFESGSERILRYLKGESISIKNHIKAIKTIRKHGLKVFGSFIIGSPNETLEDISMTYQFIKKNRIRSFSVYPLTPFPGTPVWNYALDKGFVSNNMDWTRLDVEHGGRNPIILSETLNKSELDKEYERFSRLQKRLRIYQLGRDAVHRPSKVPYYVLKAIKTHNPFGKT